MSEDLEEEALSIQLEAEEKMEKSIQSIRVEFQSIRTGRANPALLNRIHVEYYGAATPLQQLASISVPEPRMLMIQPFDKSALQEIDKAIQKSDLGIAPNNDGKVIRLNIPPLTEERRRDFVKLARKRSRKRAKWPYAMCAAMPTTRSKSSKRDKHLPQISPKTIRNNCKN
ncbi:MAG: ribosome recycling factor [Cypionkella sp.]